MCGILFFLSKLNQNIIENLINGIELIQNRGYDSMGICHYDICNNKYKIIKNVTENNNDCYNLIKNKFKNINSHVGLGHTRWATHGSKTINNAHPHISNNNKIILVHNGIINNYIDLKNFLISKNFNFYSDTDTEIIVNLIEYYISLKNNTEKAIQETINKLEGTWALIIINIDEPDTYYITRKGSPLLLGHNDNYVICTSEVRGFNGLIYDYIVLDNHDIIKITKDECKSIKNTNYNYKKISENDIILKGKLYDHWMIKEIMEQPESIQQSYNFGARILNDKIKLGGLEHLKDIINEESIKYIIILGCGTSYNAGLIGKLYFNNNNNIINTICLNACEFTKNDIPNIKNKSEILSIFLSQSGETIDVYNSLEICKEAGCITLGVINTVDSLIAREVDCGVYLNAGYEISVASTKSFTSMLVVLSLIEMWIHESYKNTKKINSLRLLSNTVKNILYNVQFIQQVDYFSDYICNNNFNNIFILGKNKLYPIAIEASLKIKEVCYIHAEGFSAGSLKHGPFALLDNTNLSILLIDYNDSKNYNSLKSTYNEILSRNTNLFVITNDITVKNELNIDDNQIMILYKLDYYNEIIFITALQYIAYNISIKKEINPDKPRNLAKVVTVE